MNHYRTVGYADDGCWDYQCLTCKSGWVGRNPPDVLYCPYCGLPIQHIQTRPHSQPRWVWDRWGKDGIYRGISTPAAPSDYAIWLFESRGKWQGEPWNEWEYDSELRDQRCNHRVARSHLAHRRIGNHSLDSPIQIECRVRRLTAAQVAEYVRTNRPPRD